jgi:hypothetical protein
MRSLPFIFAPFLKATLHPLFYEKQWQTNHSTSLRIHQAFLNAYLNGLKAWIKTVIWRRASTGSNAVESNFQTAAI